MILVVLISFGAVVVALNAAAAVAVIGGTALKRRAGGWPAPGDGQAPVPGTVTPDMAASPPSRPSPAPGPWHTSPCGCATRRNPRDILTCPGHAANREDILDLLKWADQMEDRL